VRQADGKRPVQGTNSLNNCNVSNSNLIPKRDGWRARGTGARVQLRRLMQINTHKLPPELSAFAERRRRLVYEIDSAVLRKY
jgi:hypothetical protein